MKTRLFLFLICALLAPRAVFAQGTAFTYQGRLIHGDSVASGQYEISFSLHDAAVNGALVGTPITIAPVAVSNGLFTVTLDFGAGAFTGASRWLEISVTVFGSDQPVVTLVPRQSIVPTPYALHAANAGALMSFANAPLDIKVNGQRALRLEYVRDELNRSVNLIGGCGENSIASESLACVIGGGGISGSPNIIEGHMSTISGGVGNSVRGPGAATISGGQHNAVSGSGAVIGGGFVNNLQFSDGAVIAGGEFNTISNAFVATIAGGIENEIHASYAVIGGGEANAASGHYAVIAGGIGNWAASYASVAGGGVSNQLDAAFAVIGGGEGNRITENDITIGVPPAEHSVIGGGRDNVIQGGGSVIAGGQFNSIEIGADESAGNCVIGGGGGNRTIGDLLTIAGGSGNHAAVLGATVGGGGGNVASNYYAVVSGGSGNLGIGDYSIVPGGFRNEARGRSSFAAGFHARALHLGAFVWADSSGYDPLQLYTFDSITTNEFAVRATGGVRFVTAIDAAGSSIAGVTLAPGSGAWNSLSDRNAKENFSPANPREILDKVAALPMASWNYKAQGKEIRHLGPMAQDFHAAFGLGESDRTITTVDADGVALAAIQGLNAKLEEELKAKSARISELERRLAGIEKLLATGSAR